MHVMKSQKILRLPKTVSDALDGFPQTKSMSARLAILGAAQRPELLPMALRVRAYKDKCVETVQIGIKNDKVVVDSLKGLADQFDLTVEQTFRLAVEAYIYKL